MSRALRTFTAGTLALCLGSAGLARARSAEEPPAPPKEFRIERLEWSAPPEVSRAVRRILVRNDYGDIRARFAGDGNVVVSAMVQRLGSEPDIGLNVERHGEALAVTVASPPGRRAVGEDRPGKTAVDRADLVVYVPEGAALEATTLRGIVEARRLRGEVAAETLDGEIRLDAAGPLRAHSVSGNLSVSLGARPSGATLLETGSGAVWLDLVEGSDYALQVETSGAVTSQIKLKEKQRQGTWRRLTARGGRGQFPVIVKSGSGAVEIVRRRS